ncbi:MAG TPA: response regulator transcription factor [Candidatus Paceibacterota bacterium]|jgi:two-component system OmpR family response regulator|nr:response regulator transcription factor [Candidatus Paceibacterota bacterium]
MKILVVDDDPLITDAMCIGLRADTHAVDTASNGIDASFLGRSYDYDCIILDHSLPGKNGLTVCNDIRGAGKNTPIIFVSVTGNVETKVQALDVGADDYLVKPFSMLELRSRIKAITRRAPAMQNNLILKIDDLILDLNSRSATRNNRHIHLTKKEFALIEHMMRHQGIVLSRTNLMEHVWTADSDPFSNAVEAHIRNIRKKINITGRKNLIANIQGHGYIMDTPERLTRFGK